MKKKMYYLPRTLQIIALLIIGLIIIYQFSMLKSTENTIQYQQTEKFAYSLTNIASAEVIRYLSQKNENNLQLLINDLGHDPLIKDATIYDNLGQILYQSEDPLPLSTLLKIKTTNEQQTSELSPYVSELYKDNKKIGYIRITLEKQQILSLFNQYQETSQSTIWTLLLLSFMAGLILMAIFYKNIEESYYQFIKEIQLLIKKNNSYW